jgi:hypothetical protein
LGLSESLKRDHDEYRRFFAKMAKTTAADGQIREASLKEIIIKINAHHVAEALTFLPKMMKIPEIRGLAFELEVEHAEMSRMFEALKNERVDTEIWKYKLTALYDVLHAHWLKEEEQFTPFALDYFSEADWAALGVRFDEILNEKLRKL